MNKKGMIFTLLSISLAALLLILYGWTYEAKSNTLQDAELLHAEQIDAYIFSLDSYMTLLLEVSTRNTLDAMANYVGDKGYINSLNEDFPTCFLHRQIDGNSCHLEENNSMEHWMDVLKNQTEQSLGLKFTYALNNVSIRQEYPFVVFVTLNASIQLEDLRMRWEYTQLYNGSVSVEGRVDPMYLLYTGYPQRILEQEPPQGGAWSFTQLQEMYELNSYRQRLNKSPSYLGRFTGNFTSSYCCGIETLINTSINLYPVKYNKSNTDHQMFQHQNLTCGQEVFSIIGFSDPQFQLDRWHLVSFGISPLLWSNATCP